MDERGGRGDLAQVDDAEALLAAGSFTDRQRGVYRDGFRLVTGVFVIRHPGAGNRDACLA
jgi:hypothetical protein